MSSSISDYAFPCARVKFSSGHYTATIVRGPDERYRARVSYSHHDSGKSSRLEAAWQAFEKALGSEGRAGVVPIVGDLDDREYAVTFVPKEMLTR